MKAIALRPGTRELKLTERPEPSVVSAKQLKLKVLEVGVCGTDREEAAGGRALAPAGASELVIGHEMLGQVLEVGPAVNDVQPGDLGLFSVRRGCRRCLPCLSGRNDLCGTGDYLECGIKGKDGFQTELVVDDAKYFIKSPPESAQFAVLAEPMSIVAKGIDQAARLRSIHMAEVEGSRDAFQDKSVLVAGLGAVGLLAAFALALRGAKVFGLDIFDATNPRAALLDRLDASYVDGRDPRAGREHKQRFDYVFEATGVANVEFDLFGSLARNGVYVALGIPGGDRLIELDGAAIFRNLVLSNQVLVGSVNASIGHFRTAMSDLTEADRRWPGALRSLITSRRPYLDFHEVLTVQQPNEIKAVITWASAV